jgi:phosphatidylglycerophosphate synthase
MWNQIDFPSAIRNLFTQNYLFNLNPGSSFKFLIPLAAIFGVLVIAGIILAIISWRNKNLVYKKLFGKIYTLLLTIGAIGFLLLVLRYENAYVLSGRFLWIALFLGFIIWAGIVLYYGIKKFPKDIKTYSDYLRKEKYIPKSKNH